MIKGGGLDWPTARPVSALLHGSSHVRQLSAPRRRGGASPDLIPAGDPAAGPGGICRVRADVGARIFLAERRYHQISRDKTVGFSVPRYPRVIGGGRMPAARLQR